MIRVHVICEGQTEEEFVRHILRAPLLDHEVMLLPSCIGKVGHKGGNVNLARLAFDVRERLLKDGQCYCTTFLDYYGLPTDFPGRSQGCSLTNIEDKQRLVANALLDWAKENLGGSAASRFLPYVQMYVFEGLLFSDPTQLAHTLGKSNLNTDFCAIRNAFLTPEWINDSPQTAPSKRIERLFARYDKPEHPLLIALDMGLATIRRECTLFDGWLKRIEALAGKDAI